MITLEREISREQAKLLFDLPDDGVCTYELRLVPKVYDSATRPMAQPFETEQEADEFVSRLSRKLISATR